jgi:hypothetical protein
MKEFLLKLLKRAAKVLLPPALILAAGWYCVDAARGDLKSPLIWLGAAGVCLGVYGLFLAVGQVKRFEAAPITEATGLAFRKGFWLIAADYLEMDGIYEGREVTLQNSGGSPKSGSSDEAVITVKTPADPGYRLAVYPAGLLNRPFGFFPPRLPVQPGGEGLVFRGRPAGPAQAAAGMLAAKVPELRSEQFRLLELKGGTLRLEFLKRGPSYEAREFKRLLNVALRAAGALGV